MITHADPFRKAVPKRKIVFIKRGLQLRYVFWVVTFVAVALLTFGLDFYLHFGRDVQNFMDPGLYELFKTDMRVFLLKLVVYMLGVTLFAVIGSHKLAGPLYRFERSARVVASGDLTHRVRTRYGDELGDFREEFNAMLESLHRMVSQDAQLSLRLSRRLGELSSHKSLPPDVTHKIQQLKSDVDQLHKGFKL